MIPYSTHGEIAIQYDNLFSSDAADRNRRFVDVNDGQACTADDICPYWPQLLKTLKTGSKKVVEHVQHEEPG
eukprot:4112524-Pleurochrysis_carterae.AAC.2